MSENNSNTPQSLPPAGWYPDPQDVAQQRYWDGAQWTEHSAASVAGAANAPAGATNSAAGAANTAAGVTNATAGAPAVSSSDAATAAYGTAPAAAAFGGAAAVSTKRGLPKLKWWQWGLIAFAVLVLVSMIVNGITGGSASSDAEPARIAGETETSREPAEEVEPTEEPVEMVQVPSLVGVTVAEARAALDAVGLTLVASEAGEDWVVTAQQPSAGSHPVEGLELSITSEAPKPVYTLAQQNAIGKAQSYLNFTGFSRQGLIEQLEFEGYSTDEAIFGADNAGADWNAEAAEKAASYLELTSFSRQGLYDQLAFEGFTDAEIQFGLAAVGY